MNKEQIELNAPETRAALSKMIIKLFKLWNIAQAEQLNLLGLSPKSRAMLTRYAKGKTLPATRDMLDRVGWLLSIHKSLGLLYPRNEDVRYGWVKQRNTAFDNLTPLDVMKEQGIIGIAKVARCLDFYLKQ